MHDGCKWLPVPIAQQRGETTQQYLNKLHDVFNREFNYERPQFMGKDVLYDANPPVNGWEQAFYHLTTVDDHTTYGGGRTIDYARAECIGWIRPVIEHYACQERCCDGLKVWRVKRRIHILFEKVRYLVVLQKHSHNYIIVTAFRITIPHELQSKLKQYEYYKDVPLN